MAFLARAAQRGPRHVPPAEFPHLVPSAPAGNASVYAALTGPVFAVSDLAQSGEAALAAGADLIELGVAERCVVGAIAPRDAIVERVLGPLLGSGAGAAARSEGAAFVLLEAAASPLAGGLLLLGRYAGELLPQQGLPSLPAPEVPASARVLLGAATREVHGALALSAWGAVERMDMVVQHGYHEALGAVAFASALELMSGARDVSSVLVLSGGPVAFSAWILGRASAEEH